MKSFENLSSFSHCLDQYRTILHNLSVSNLQSYDRETIAVFNKVVRKGEDKFLREFASLMSAEKDVAPEAVAVAPVLNAPPADAVVMTETGATKSVAEASEKGEVKMIKSSLKADKKGVVRRVVE